MPEQTQLECVSCDTTFDPTPNGGFCPDCDTPHPDFGQEETDADDAEPEVDDSQMVCPHCGEVIDVDAEDDVEEVSFDEADTDDTDDDAVADDSVTDAVDDAVADAADEAPSSVTLIVNGESYTMSDGDTFGRQDEDWLQDLVDAAGGTDEVSYVSGTHLEFSAEDDGVHVTDVSTNGTALNGSDLGGGSAKLEDGDTLELAERVEIDVQI